MTYSGSIRGSSDGTFGASGRFSLTADFNDNAVAGEFAFDDFDLNAANIGGSVTLELASTPITGNGFAGDLTATDCSFGTCTSNSAIGGVFYGENPEEVAGTILIDITATNDAGDSDQVTGVAAFGGAPPM